MKCFSQSLCVILVTCVHPDQPGTSFAPPADLDENKVPCLARPPHFVPIPRDNRSGVVAGADDLQLTHGDVGDTATQSQDVESENATLGAHLLGQDVHWPNGI